MTGIEELLKKDINFQRARGNWSHLSFMTEVYQTLVSQRHEIKSLTAEKLALQQKVFDGGRG